jgi:hypothetical protein
VVARIVLWDLAESETTVEELRDRLPELELTAGDRWIWNTARERFGLISFAAEPPDIGALIELIGDEPVLVEEFDAA